MRNNYYQTRSVYGIGHTRLQRIQEIVGNTSGKRILDVGCADGRLGAVLKRKDNYVAGVELSSDAIVRARVLLDRIYEADIEQPWPHDLSHERFDVVILSEVVEHVFDPAALLVQARGVLNGNGCIILTTPNFMTWTNRLRFLIGDFAYRSEGMFDFGHIRWFTYRYLNDALRESGFGVQQENHIFFPGKLTRILRFWPSLFAWQFVVRAVRQSP